MKLILKFILFINLFFSIQILAEEDTVLTSTLFGFSIDLPDSWQILNEKLNEINVERTKLKSKEFREIVQKYYSAPLISIMKKPTSNDLTPSIKVQVKLINQNTVPDPMNILAFIIDILKPQLKDFNIVIKPKRTKLAGISSAYTQINYTLELDDGRSFPSTSETLIVPQKGYYFFICAETRQDEKSGKRSEVYKILQSIKIEKGIK